MRFFLALDSVLSTILEDGGEMWALLELGVELEGVASTMGGEPLSAGCLAGSRISGVRLLSTSCPCTPSTYPISPHFSGKGSTSDRDSDGMCEGEEAVDAIFKLSIYHRFMEPAPPSLTKELTGACSRQDGRRKERRIYAVVLERT